MRTPEGTSSYTGQKPRRRGDVDCTWTFLGLDQCCGIPSHAACHKVAVASTVVASTGVPTSPSKSGDTH